jgi:hypothetical protein
VIRVTELQRGGTSNADADGLEDLSDFGPDPRSEAFDVELLTDRWESVANCIAHLQSSLLLIEDLSAHPDMDGPEVVDLDLAGRKVAAVLVLLEAWTKPLLPTRPVRHESLEPTRPRVGCCHWQSTAMTTPAPLGTSRAGLLSPSSKERDDEQ